MSTRDRSAKLQSYGNAPALLAETLSRFPKHMWHYKASDGWNVQQIVVHIADSEANGYVRCRQIIAESGNVIRPYAEDVWAEKLDYEHQDANDAFELFRWLRRTTYQLIQTLPEPVWANTMAHPERGLLTLDDWLDIYEVHIHTHIAQMEDVYSQWLKENN
jgi:hypothetical protein